MRTSPVAAGVVLALVLGGGPMSREAAAQPPASDGLPVVSAETAARLQAALDVWARHPAHRGVTAAVVLQDGAEWTGAAGLAGVGEPVRPAHLIGIASITKTMTGAVILQLVDEGVVRLDDSIERWLAPIANVPPEITVRQLLNHTGGLANYTASAALGAAIAGDPTRVFQPDELLAFLDPPHFAPGERTEYTNTAFLLLGLVAEAATGRPILELYHQRLWGPRNLTGVFLPLVEAPPAPVAAALGRAGLVEPLTEPAVLSIGQSAFGLYADAITVARWGHALFLGDVVTPETQAAMRELVPAAGNIPGESGAGLGIRGYEYFDRPEFGHSGGMSFGSSLLLFEPESGATVVVLANQGPNAGHFLLAPELLRVVAGLP